jgi:GT2 family glycosyltransferase
MHPTFSLLLCTLHRTQEVGAFFAALKLQKYPLENVTVVVVDQNPDDRLVEIVSRAQNFCTVVHLRSEIGLSRARNGGLPYCTGDIVAFPDDDCWYPPQLLQQIADFFAQHPHKTGVSAKPTDGKGNISVGRFTNVAASLNKSNVWRLACSISVFYKRAVIEAVGGFDENLGVGAGTPWGSGEDTDYPLRVLENGFQIEYIPSIEVHHPQVVLAYTGNAFKRGFSYGAGMGYVLQKHQYTFFTYLKHVLRPFIGALLSLAQGRLGKARFHWAVARGRAWGILYCKTHNKNKRS